MNLTLNKLKEMINESDAILIGGGSGLSTASGVSMGGNGFQENFKPWIDKYHFKDLYTSSFYNFKTEEEKWAYFGKYIKYIDIDMEGKELYKKIYKLVRGKNYFVITTNTDDQFFKTGFDKKKIFRVQGSYRLLQCSTPCHDKLYDAEDICNKLVQNIDKDLKVPSNLVPKCPKCGENMEVNLRKDGTFVQDSNWYSMANRYDKFLNDNKDKKVLFLEFGVGFNTPSIIRFPFEEMTSKNKNFTLIRFNKDSRCFYNMGCRFIEVREDLNKFFS